MKLTLMFPSKWIILKLNLLLFSLYHNASWVSSYGTPSSSSSGRSREFPPQSPYFRHGDFRKTENRAKWGDRGVTIGHFYDPSEKDNSKVGPEWLERGLHDTRDSGDES